jgi:murein DD-endopeptidase MepM/ murein hydrolase activator NlpD
VSKFRNAFVLALVLTFAVVGTASAHWPVASRSSYISSGYWSMRYVPVRHYHRAFDIAAARGTRIVPVVGGKVIFAGWKRNGGGWQVWVRQSDGRSAVYSHMNRRPPVRYGQAVRTQSTTLGYVGSSGFTNGRPHLHLAIFRGPVPFRSAPVSVTTLRAYIMHGYWLPSAYRR